MAQLPDDCLTDIFEHLKDDTKTLYSCLLVNHLWCDASVRICWRYVWKFKNSHFRTLIACLPNTSKEILYKNGIIIPIPTSKPPMFNYAKFCKNLCTCSIHFGLMKLLKNHQQSISEEKLKMNLSILEQEILRLYMREITSFKTKDCLKNLSELFCSSDSFEFLYRLSGICQNILSLNLSLDDDGICQKILSLLGLDDDVSEGLTNLISAQKNLKVLRITYYSEESLGKIINSFINPNNLIQLSLGRIEHNISYSFIAQFTNIQELKLIFNYNSEFEDLNELDYIIFSRLQILKIYDFPLNYEKLIPFLANHEKNLKKLCVIERLCSRKFSTKFKKLFIEIRNNELEFFKVAFNSCRYVESVKIWCESPYLGDKQALESIIKYSHENIHEIRLFYRNDLASMLLPSELNSFFESWMIRKPKKPLSFIIEKFESQRFTLDSNDENMGIIKKYIRLGVIKRFVVTSPKDDDDFNTF
ncbi:hypothetical protein C1645_811584 [Glomus cerebriforme]|uniref:F-box domain-containing protein n=1 Tax=Glomus cerebriforme TaxID=658196 RepID=A0A397TRT3_9GLOM|nr:hypothetical protein C1645_811584 [Glomus cerebriforme]